MSIDENTIDVIPENTETSNNEVESSTNNTNKLNLSNFINSEDSIYKNIPYLTIIPKQIRDNKKSRYCYPEEYQNKIYRTKDKFVLFSESSYTEVSFGLIYLLSQILNNNPNISERGYDNNYDFEILSNNIKQCLDKYQETIENQNLIAKELEAISNAINSIGEVVVDHSQKFDNIQDIIKTVDIEQFAQIKSEISKIIENYSSSTTDLGQSFDNLISDMNSIKTRLDNLEKLKNEKINIDNLDLSEYITSSMFKIFKENIEQQLSNISNEISKSQSNTSSTVKLNIDELSKLKEAGYSAEEIYQLKILKLI